MKYPTLKYRPDFKLSDTCALNADGLYWHSELVQQDKNYHFNMRKEYEELCLRIFQFRENEIKEKMEIVKSIINNNLKLLNSKIGARKTSVIEASQYDATRFLNENHIKGSITAKHLSLIYNGEIVSILSYSIRNKIMKIDRFCSKINLNIIGSFSKLLKAAMLKAESENKEVSKINYWVDLRYGTGNFLIGLGFIHSHDSLGWEWTDMQHTYNRLRCRANMDDRKLSQMEYAKELRWVKIYDAGQRLFVMELI